MITHVHQIVQRKQSAAAQIRCWVLALESQILPSLVNHCRLFSLRKGRLVQLQQQLLT